MNQKFRLVIVSATAILWVASRALAGPNDYMFQPVKTQVQQGDDVIVAVRLIHKKTRKPVSNAEITIKRIDMKSGRQWAK